MSDITSVLNEKRSFKPSPEFVKKARISSVAAYKKLYEESLKRPDKFWGSVAKELHWEKPWRKTVEWKAPFAKWFVGGRTNLAYNCLDRHLATARKNKAALVWEGEPGDSRTFTYKELHHEVCKFANVLLSLGVKPKDRVAIYMPLVPELAIAMLACARIGATHSIVFGGFSAEALRDRINDAKAKVLVTADGGWRRGKIVPLKAWADDAVAHCPSVEKVVVVRRTGEPVTMKGGRDHWWHDLTAGASPKHKAPWLDAEHPLFILYTSGTTGKPKGVVHTTGGYMVGTYLTTKYVFDLRDEDTYWCTADVGWVTGHSYVVYGPLANGATSVMYEGAPDFPRQDRLWSIVEKHAVSIFYTAPTAIRAFVKWGDAHPKGRDLSSLRLLGTVGEPINPEAWTWYHRVIGGGRCPIVDTWWQTETGAIMITTLPGAMAAKPGSAGLPMFGVEAEVVDKAGRPVKPDQGGYLVVKRPWPSIMRTIYGDPERFKQTYFSHYKGIYFTGDGARRDKDGYFWVMGRVDDVINVAGHRLGTMEIESALVSHRDVAEAAVVGRPDELKGSAVYAFVTLAGGKKGDEKMKEALKAHVVKEIGAIARPDEIQFTEALPKTRSGKIMRRLLRDIAAGTATVGDTSTLEDLSVLAKLRESDEE